jgi:hypothetical protein
MSQVLYSRRSALAVIVASLALAACGGSSAQTPADGPKSGAKSAVVDGVILLKGETLSAEAVAPPGMPIYPNAQTIALEGIGPSLKIASATTVLYALPEGTTFLDVATFYKTKLEAEGWKSEIGDLLKPKAEDAVGLLAYGKDDAAAQLTFTNGVAQKTGPRLSILVAALPKK